MSKRKEKKPDGIKVHEITGYVHRFFMHGPSEKEKARMHDILTTIRALNGSFVFPIVNMYSDWNMSWDTESKPVEVLTIETTELGRKEFLGRVLYDKDLMPRISVRDCYQYPSRPLDPVKDSLPQ